MSFNDSQAVAITTDATRIVLPSVTRCAILIQNNSSTIPVYIGQNSSVTAATGLVIPVSQSFSDSGEGCHKGEWWGITSSGSSDLRVTDQYLVQIAGQPAR